MKKNITATILSFIFCMAFLGSGIAWGQYPNSSKIIRIICPASPGGSSDTQIRALSVGLAKHLNGTSVQVENVAGAAGKIAYEQAFRSKPDGYTLLNFNLPAPIVTETAEKTSYVTSKFVPIYAVSIVPNMLVVAAGTWKTFDEFIKDAQHRKVTIGTMGNKSANWLQAVAFAKATHIKATMVPFRGGKNAVQALAGRHIDAVCTLTLSAFPLVRAGELKPLIIFNDKKDLMYPGCPIPKDTKWDIPCLPLVSAYVGPPGLSAEKAKILEEAFSKAVKEPGFLSWAKKVNLHIVPMGAQKLEQVIENGYSNIEKYHGYLK